MIRSFRWFAGLALLAACAASVPVSAQGVHITFDTFDNPAVRVLQDYTLRAEDTARQVVVVGGDAKIEGRVTGDMVVVLGRAELASSAIVEGNLVLVAGTADVAEGARVDRDFVVIGGARTTGSFHPGGVHVVIGTPVLGDSLRALVPWLTKGLLLGRPIVPSLGWVWIVAGVFFLLNLCLNVLFDGPVRSCATTLRATPFSSFMAGLLVLLLFGPVCTLLAVSVIGVAVIPFVLCAMLVAGLLGRIAFARWLGMSLFAQSDPADRAQSMRSFLIGSALMCVAYMIPFIGFMVWTLAGVFGLGAATLTFYSSYRRENPKPPKKTVPVAPPPAPVDAVAPAAPYQALENSSFQAVEPEPAQASAIAQELTPADLPPAAGAVAFPRGTFVERLAAFALDVIVVAIVAQFLDFDRYHDPNARFFLAIALAYHVGFWTWRATTPGGMICQLRVVRTDGKRLEFPESLVRGLTGILSLVVAGIGFLWMLRDPERQTWHDRVAGTFVVKVPRAYPI